MDFYMATVLIWAPNFAPRQFAYCAGQLMSIAQNSALYSLIGTIYGGDGRTTFGLPDLRSRVPVGGGMGAGPALSNYNLGVMSGVENVTLNITQMPTHNHLAQGELVAVATNATSSAPQTGSFLGSVGVPDGPSFSPVNAYTTTSGSSVTLAQGSVSVQVGNSGFNQSHENRQPFLGISFIICLEGLFPPRS